MLKINHMMTDRHHSTARFFCLALVILSSLALHLNTYAGGGTPSAPQTIDSTTVHNEETASNFALAPPPNIAVESEDQFRSDRLAAHPELPVLASLQNLPPRIAQFRTRLSYLLSGMTPIQTAMQVNFKKTYLDFEVWQIKIQRKPHFSEHFFLFQVTHIPSVDQKKSAIAQHSQVFNKTEYRKYFTEPKKLTADSYDFKIFEGTTAHPDHLFAEVVIDDQGQAAEIFWISKRQHTSGKQALELAQSLISAFNIPFSYVYDDATLTRDCGPELGQSEFKLRNYSAFLFPETPSWYQKMGDFQPLKFFNLTSRFKFQSQLAYTTAADFLNRYPLHQLVQTFSAQTEAEQPSIHLEEVRKKRLEVLTSLIQYAFPAETPDFALAGSLTGSLAGWIDPKWTLGDLVRKLDPRTSPDHSEQLIQFHHLYHLILTNTLKIAENKNYFPLLPSLKAATQKLLLTQRPDAVRTFDLALEAVAHTALWYRGLPPVKFHPHPSSVSHAPPSSHFNFEGEQNFLTLIGNLATAQTWDEIVPQEAARLQLALQSAPNPSGNPPPKRKTGKNTAIERPTKHFKEDSTEAAQKAGDEAADDSSSTFAVVYYAWEKWQEKLDQTSFAPDMSIDNNLRFFNQTFLTAEDPKSSIAWLDHPNLPHGTSFQITLSLDPAHGTYWLRWDVYEGFTFQEYFLSAQINPAQNLLKLFDHTGQYESARPSVNLWMEKFFNAMGLLEESL